ncbi:hypothetical protein DP114_29360 [Brasilonema sennae CENA114]|nr:condensation domain-containing protein [Brasilonema sennae]QDL11462.1 hypothetical protein DP114_29360 [Brasilonema sennae CENA114]
MIENFQIILETVVINPQQQIDQIPLQRLPERKQECEELTIIESSTECISEKTYIEPHTQTQKELAEIWRQVLEVESISINDNFFKLGGYSLRATQVVYRICKTFEIDMPLTSLFEEPTILGLASNIEKLRQSKQGGQNSHKVETVSRDQPLSLSFSQASLWFLAQLQPDSSAYNISAAVHIQGSLDIATLEKSFHEIVRRHEVLRTSFRIINGQPVQVISPNLILPISVVELQHLPNQHLSAEVQRLANQEAQQPFDLCNAPLLRTTLVSLGTQEYVLLVTMHHIISDGWSMAILIQELSELYRTFAMGLPSSLPTLPIQYADFANWQQQWLQGEVLETHMSYWKQQLAGIPKLLDIPTDYPRPDVQSFRGAKQRLALSVPLSDALKNLSQQEGVTLFMTLLAAVETLFYRYSSQEDIVVGSPVANRNQVEIEQLIGFFVNTLVLRTNMSGNPSFRELLARVRQMSLSAYEHQDLPFEKLVEELQPERNLSYNPLFQAMFSLNVPTPTFDLPALTVSSLEIEDKTAKFDLTLNLEDTAQGLKGWFEYSTDLFDQSTIVQMIENFQTILETVVINPQQQIDQIPLQNLPERKVDNRTLATTKITADDVPYVPPRDTIELLLAQIWSELLNKNPVGVRDNFFELGGYSLLTVLLISQIQQKFNTLLPLETLFQAPTIEHLAKLIRAASQTLPFSALVPIQPQGSRPPLFCIHPGGGNILCYRELASCLGINQPLYGLQSIALNPECQPHTQIEQMAAHYLEQIQTIQPKGPYLLCGWSLGGVIAFEMAKQCYSQKQSIGLLVVIDAYPPHTITHEPIDDASILVEHFADNLPLSIEDLRRMELDEQLIFVTQQARQQNLVSLDFDVNIAQHLLNVYKLNDEAMKAYVPQYYPGSMVLIRARESNPSLASEWDALVERVEHYEISANHQNILNLDNAKVVAEKLSALLQSMVN